MSTITWTAHIWLWKLKKKSLKIFYGDQLDTVCQLAAARELASILSNNVEEMYVLNSDRLLAISTFVLEIVHNLPNSSFIFIVTAFQACQLREYDQYAESTG